MRPYCLTFVVIVAVVLAEPYAKRGGREAEAEARRRRSSSGGSSSHYSYPSSSGYSGNSAGNSHSYPSSTGLSGNSQKTTYQQSQQQHAYPSGTGLSGSGHTTYQQNQQHHTNTHNSYSKTEVHHHYHYSPPPRISYGSTYHPVYQASPPIYVYEYRNSGSRFDTLLTGLALYNLGRMSERHSHYDVNREYRTNPGEVCKLGISKHNGEYEETRIDFRLMTSFILESGTQPATTNHNVVSTNKSTTTVVEITNGTGNNGTSNTKVTTVTENKTVVNALEVKGPSISVTPDMKCFMIHISRDTSMTKRNVDCALLQ
ncbi:uncharacterized protein LOC115446712, partial [Manduca sexta]|uniref:uncharacterized protein LOC115446712 n=1 Tax=Manduca sexta TaxID=7130 RepID=UPI0018902B5D